MTGHRERIRFEAYDDPREYKFLQRYAETKLAYILMSRELQRRMEDKYGGDVQFYSKSRQYRDGEDHVRLWLKNVVSGVKRIFMTTPNQGAKSIVFLATSSDVQVYLARRLWEWSLDVVRGKRVEV